MTEPKRHADEGQEDEDRSNQRRLRIGGALAAAVPRSRELPAEVVEDALARARLWEVGRRL